MNWLSIVKGYSVPANADWKFMPMHIIAMLDMRVHPHISDYNSTAAGFAWAQHDCISLPLLALAYYAWLLCFSIPTVVCYYLPLLQLLVKDETIHVHWQRTEHYCLENGVHDIFTGMLRRQWKAHCSSKYRMKGHLNSCSFLFFIFHLKQCSGICT